MVSRIPQVMSGMVLTGHGGYDKLDWREDLPVPVPGVGEVLIRIISSSVNNTDINTRIGWYSKSVRSATGSDDVSSAANVIDSSWTGSPLELPRIQGADCYGEIVAVGRNVPASRMGETVLVRTMQISKDSAGQPVTWTFGSECDGGFAQYTKIASANALRIQSNLPAEMLGVLPCAYSTAECMLQRARLGSEHVLVTGASGGVGLALVQLARMRGARVTAMTSPENADNLRQAGADAIFYRDDPLPAGHFDVVADVVAGPRWPDMIASLKRAGRYVVSGAIAGPIVELDVRTLYLKDLSLLGSTFQPLNIMKDVISYVEQGLLRPNVAAVFRLQDLVKAQIAFQDKSHFGKIPIMV